MPRSELSGPNPRNANEPSSLREQSLTAPKLPRIRWDISRPDCSNQSSDCTAVSRGVDGPFQHYLQMRLPHAR